MLYRVQFFSSTEFSYWVQHNRFSVHGDTCSQLFLGDESDRMEVYPLRTESHSGEALQDFSRQVGLAQSIKTDNAKTEVGRVWTQHCREHCINQLATEPHHPWQNKAERGIGDLERMVRRCMRIFGAPANVHDWCQKWCADVRNHLASRILKWRTPMEKSTGDTPDISSFQFHFWEPIWYFWPIRQFPRRIWSLWTRRSQTDPW